MATDVKQKVLFELKVNGVDKASGEMKELEGASGGVSGAFAGIPPEAALVAAAVVAAAAAIVVLTKAAIDNTNVMAAQNASLFNNARAANVTIEEYQQLNYVLRQTTGQMNGAEKQYRSINTFLLSAAGSTGIQGRALADLNLEYDALFAMNPQERYMALTNAVGALTDKTQQNTIAAAIFGARYSSQVVAALNQSGGSMQGMMDIFAESNMMLSTESVAALKKYDDAVTDFDVTMDAFKTGVAVDMLPIMGRVVDAGIEIAGVLGDLKGPFLEGIVVIGAFTTAELINIGVTGKLTFMTGLAAAAKLKLAAATAVAKAALIGPAGVAAAVVFTSIQFYKLGKAIDSATGAIEANDAAEQLATSNRVRAGTLLLDIQNAVQQGAELSATAVEGYIEQIEAMGLSEQDTADITRAFHQLLSGTPEALRLAVDASLELTMKSDDLSLALLDEARAAIVAETGLKRLHAEMSGGPTILNAEIARARDEIERIEAMMETVKGRHMVSAKPTGGVSAGAGAGTAAPSPTFPERRPEVMSPFGGVTPEMSARGDVDAYMSTYTEAMAVANEELTGIEMVRMEEVYNLQMEFASRGVDALVDNWGQGSEAIKANMKKMFEDLMKELIKSGLLTALSTAFGGGGVGIGAGIFGQLLGGKK